MDCSKLEYVRTSCKYEKKIYLPVIIFDKSNGINIIDFFDNCSFEGGLRGFGELFCSELEADSADRKGLADGLSQYVSYYNFDNDRDSTIIQLSKWFAMHTLNGLYSLSDTDAKDKVAYILDHCLSNRFACAKMDEVLPDKAKEVFDRWLSGSTYKELVTESYKDYTNSHFADNPKLQEEMLYRQKKLFGELINRGEFNTVQANFAVQLLTRYAVATSDNPIERFWDICPVIETFNHVEQVKYKRKMLGNEAVVKENSENKPEKTKTSEPRQGFFSKLMSWFRS